MQKTIAPNVTATLAACGKGYPLVEVTAPISALTDTIIQACHEHAGDHGAGVHFTLTGDAKIFRRAFGRDPRYTLAA